MLVLMNLVILLGVSVDTQPVALTHEWQTLLMDEFYADISEKELKKLVYNAYKLGARQDYCSWTGVKCYDGQVTQVDYMQKSCGNFRLHTLPPTVSYVSICVCRQHSELHTRCLPKSLVYLILSVNKLYGRLDLTQLPKKLEHASLWHNRFIGPITLTCLPPALRRLELHENRIVQDVVWYGNLPETVEELKLTSIWHPSRIGEVCAVDMHQRSNPNIFSHMPWEKIR
uniref:Leucine-rich repeat-containing N-terminal plant-type domain-containing protein n=1 Tax=Paramoeba aestuarina TaxID=180227 RepID=A0A7S4L995_9EUKA|mmetsp:Transcript_33631/g.52571  ORF Transcript_33631/g.52571 Transcript_33631/m.52571 type:complete len:228 (+) Transcript_33631:33-716(+)